MLRPSIWLNESVPCPAPLLVPPRSYHHRPERNPQGTPARCRRTWRHWEDLEAGPGAQVEVQAEVQAGLEVVAGPEAAGEQSAAAERRGRQS